MAKLDEAVKLFIVQRLACFRTPSQVVDEVKAEYGVVVKREHVRHYNPDPVHNAAAGANIGDRWHKIFWATREKFLTQSAAHGLAHEAYRLSVLQTILEKAMSRNMPLAVEIVKTAHGWYPPGEGGDSGEVTPGDTPVSAMDYLETQIGADLNYRAPRVPFKRK